MRNENVGIDEDGRETGRMRENWICEDGLREND